MSTHVHHLLSAWLDGELSASACAGVDAHLRECPECARSAGELRAVDDLARREPVPEPPGYFEALPGRVRDRLAPRRRARVPSWAVALAAGIVVAVLVPLTLKETGRDRSPVLAPAPPGNESLTAPAPPTHDGRPASAPGAVSGTLARKPLDASDRREAFDRGIGRDRGSESEPVPRATEERVDRLAPRREVGEERGIARRGPGAPAAPSRTLAAGAAAAPARPVRAPAVSVVEAQAVEDRAQDTRLAPASAPPRAEAAAEAQTADQDQPDLVSDDAGPERDAPAVTTPRLTAASGARAEAARERFQSLGTRAAESAAEARALRDAWQAFVRDHPDSPYADEARVRALEAGAAAWRLGGVLADRQQVERAGREYLRRPEAAQKERVRALLAGLRP